MPSSGECYFCNSEVDIEEHHILPQRFDGSDLPGNTVDLCHDCHWKLERLYNKDFWKAIGVDDPRATKESHVTCEYHSCLNPAVGRYHTSGDVGGSVVVYRCEEHMPERDGSAGESEDAGDGLSLRSVQKEETSSSNVCENLELFLGGEPMEADDLRDLVDNLYFEGSGDAVTEFQGTVESQIYHGKYVDGEWTVRHVGELD